MNNLFSGEGLSDIEKSQFLVGVYLRQLAQFENMFATYNAGIDAVEAATNVPEQFVEFSKLLVLANFMLWLDDMIGAMSDDQKAALSYVVNFFQSTTSPLIPDARNLQHLTTMMVPFKTAFRPEEGGS